MDSPLFHMLVGYLAACTAAGWLLSGTRIRWLRRAALAAAILATTQMEWETGRYGPPVDVFRAWAIAITTIIATGTGESFHVWRRHHRAHNRSQVAESVEAGGKRSR